jgi:uncharacterized protein
MSTLTLASGIPVIRATPDERSLFIRRTYAHLAGAVGLFIVLEYLLLRSSVAKVMIDFVAARQYGWLMILGAFIVVGWLARGLAANVASVNVQYAGLGLYVLAEAIIFVPLLYIAVHLSNRDVLPTAAILTILLFLGLTMVAMTTRRDFSFLGSILTMGGFVAVGLIVCGTIFGFTLGLAFSGAMVVLACGAILYDTSKILHQYSTNQHVAAALELFASVALLFWYVLRIAMRLSRD